MKVTKNDTFSSTDNADDFDPFAGGDLATTFATTEPQKEVWLSSQLGADASCSYNESIVLQLNGKFDREAFQAALDDVLLRHDALRAKISANGEALMIAQSMSAPIEYHDLSKFDSDVQEQRTEKLREQEVTSPFDLLNGPLIRVHCLRLGDARHDIIISAHHIVCDGWSFEPLLSDLSALYSARINGELATLAPADSFEDYVARHSDTDYADEIRESEEYWLQRFRSVPSQTEIASDFARPRERSFEAECLQWELSIPLIEQLQKVGAAHRCSLMTTMLCAFEVFVSRLTGLKDLVIGVPSAGQLAFDCPRLVGHCVNLLPIRAHLEESLTFTDYLKSRRAQVLSDFDHQKFTYGSLIKSLKLGRDVSRMPLTSLMFNIDQPLEGVNFAGLDCRIQSNPRRFEAFEQFYNLTIDDTVALIECQFNTNLFDGGLMRERLESFQAILEEIARNPDQRISDLPLVSAAQRERLLRTWGEGEAEDTEQSTFLHAFDAIADERPESIACEFEGEKWTYRQISDMAANAAGALSSAGCKPGAHVGLMMSRSHRLIVSILAAMKCGAAYVPLDPKFPAERLSFIAEDSALAAVLIDGSADLPDLNVPTIDIDNAVANGNAVANSPDSDSAAYLIYTSGSTGRPKGVVISHSNLINFLASMIRQPGLSSDDRLLAVTSPSFDISILELLGPLMIGGTVVVADDDTTIDGALLAKALGGDITCMQATPSTWRMLKESGWSGSDKLLALCGGEALDPLLADWLADNTRAAWNMYGPTETTIWSAIKHLQSGARPVTLGRPITNTSLLVVDGNQQLLPAGTPGELLIGGMGVASGYWRRDELTAERFRDNPHGDGRVYATGDEVRYASNGELEFLGRLDNQIKLHGFRIELGEIEAILQQDPAVDQAVVMAREFKPGDTRLVAWAKPDGNHQVDTDALRKMIAGKLPAYMVPNHIVAVSEFPLTPNRKIDRKALPLPNLGNGKAAEAKAKLETDSQRTVAKIWSDVLGASVMSQDDDFFDLGGHSILVTRVIARFRDECGVDLPFRRFFEAPNVADVADALDALRLLTDRPRATTGDSELEEIEI